MKRVNQIITALKGRARRWLANRLPYSNIRTDEWHVERREGNNIIKGTAIGFSYTDKDRILVPGMLKSFYFAEFVVSYYDSAERKSFDFDESERHKAIIRKARQAGAKYFWGVGPKRRISKETIQSIRENMYLVKEGHLIITKYRYPWGKDLKNIRTDGVYGRRYTSAFFPILKTNQYSRKPLHHRWHPRNLPKKHLDCIQYHLGRNSEEVVKKKFEFYKSQEYKSKFWKSLEIKDLVPDKIEISPINEKILGIGWRERHFKDW